MIWLYRQDSGYRRGITLKRYLARPDSKVLALIGAGQQGRNQLQATLTVLPAISEVYVYDAYRPAAEACAAAAVIVTATPSFQAVVMAPWIRPGTHINAVGTDTRGKQELDPQIFALADKIVVDNINQCLYLGECQHAFDAGIISRETVHAEIGEIIAGRRPGHQQPDEVTSFDTTGVAIQDLATAGYALAQARLRGAGGKITI